jgi:hypothetical protein
MAETVLPGVSIEVRAEGLIIPLGVTIGTLGVVGTANKGPIGTPVLLGSYAEAQATFGAYDPWIDGASNELTLVRALELAFNQGATTVIAVRVAGASKKTATLMLKSAGGDNVELAAKSEGTAANDIEVNVAKAEANAFVEDEEVAANKLSHFTVVPSARNRIRVKPGGGGLEQTLQILYDSAPPPNPGQVNVKTSDGTLTFGTAPAGTDKVLASYMADKSKAVKVTLRYKGTEEVFTAVSGDDLVRDLNDPLQGSALVKGTAKGSSDELPAESPAGSFARLAGGDNGASGAVYQNGLDALLNEPAHIIVAAGQDDGFGDELAAHCQQASSDLLKRDRIAVVGSRLGASLSDLQGHTLNSDRVIFVGPGIKVNDRAATPPVEVTLPGAYAAAAIAGLISSFEPHVSPTNKVLPVGGLERVFTTPELRSLVQSRVLALEKRDGFRIVKGITTSTDTAWHQITTRRIVDYAKAGVRSAANPFIGKLNNERVRGALRSSINSFLADMIESEMLISYELDVSATRQQEIRGIVQVTMVLRPTFSIDFIRVTIFLE